MELNDYQQKAMTTCMESSNNVAYMFYNLLGEVGELAEKVADIITDKSEKRQLKKVTAMLELYGASAKFIRKNPDTLAADEHRHVFNRLRYATDEQRNELMKEAGDILWQLSGLCNVMGWSLDTVAQMNLDKLASRQERNQIDGDGDNR